MNLVSVGLGSVQGKKKARPGRTFRESQATWKNFHAARTRRQNRLHALKHFAQLSSAVRCICAEVCFRLVSTWFVAASCTCSSWLNPIFILCLTLWRGCAIFGAGVPNCTVIFAPAALALPRPASDS